VIGWAKKNIRRRLNPKMKTTSYIVSRKCCFSNKKRFNFKRCWSVLFDTNEENLSVLSSLFLFVSAVFIVNFSKPSISPSSYQPFCLSHTHFSFSFNNLQPSLSFSLYNNVSGCGYSIHSNLSLTPHFRIYTR
jgi:hypothetical protein